MSLEARVTVIRDPFRVLLAHVRPEHGPSAEVAGLQILRRSDVEEFPLVVVVDLITNHLPQSGVQQFHELTFARRVLASRPLRGLDLVDRSLIADARPSSFPQVMETDDAPLADDELAARKIALKLHLDCFVACQLGGSDE